MNTPFNESIAVRDALIQQTTQPTAFHEVAVHISAHFLQQLGADVSSGVHIRDIHSVYDKHTLAIVFAHYGQQLMLMLQSAPASVARDEHIAQLQETYGAYIAQSPNTADREAALAHIEQTLQDGNTLFENIEPKTRNTWLHQYGIDMLHHIVNATQNTTTTRTLTQFLTVCATQNAQEVGTINSALITYLYAQLNDDEIDTLQRIPHLRMYNPYNITSHGVHLLVKFQSAQPYEDCDTRQKCTTNKINNTNGRSYSSKREGIPSSLSLRTIMP